MAKIQKLAWLGDPNLKEQVVLRMKEHRVEDSIVQGIYQRYAPEKATKYRGCLLGCTLPRVVNRGAVEASSTLGWPGKVEDLYGIPRQVAYLLENIFENLDLQDCADFAVASIEAIPVGADLSAVEKFYETRSNGECRCTDCSPNYDRTVEKDFVLELLKNAPVPEPAQ